MKNFLKIISGGTTTSIQDRGRFGFQDRGIPPSGVVNVNNLMIANALVGNEIFHEVLEIFFDGPTIEINVDCISVALVASSKSYIQIINNNLIIQSGRSINLKRGDIIKINLGKDCLIGTFSFSASIKNSEFLGSKSTNPNIGIGGNNGSFFQDSSDLKIENVRVSKEKLLNADTLSRNTLRQIRVMAGYHEQLFDEKILNDFYNNSWTISNNINRMGIILEGKSLKYNDIKNLFSDGNITGSIQLPSNGLPIILLPDRGTTGGYPKIASIISSDLFKLSYLSIGEKITFKKVDYEYAMYEINIQRQHIKNLLQRIKEI